MDGIEHFQKAMFTCGEESGSQSWLAGHSRAVSRLVGGWKCECEHFGHTRYLGIGNRRLIGFCAIEVVSDSDRGQTR
uniref:Secreted protein n=1 Tax=Panagrellus redivivus TaxID=6233 RepID=A0A7E4VCN4_PANRE